MSSRSQAENVNFSAIMDSWQTSKCAHGGREPQHPTEANFLLKGYKLGGCHARLEVIKLIASFIIIYRAL